MPLRGVTGPALSCSSEVLMTIAPKVLGSDAHRPFEASSSCWEQRTLPSKRLSSPSAVFPLLPPGCCGDKENNPLCSQSGQALQVRGVVAELRESVFAKAAPLAKPEFP